MPEAIAAIDLGSSSIKVAIADSAGATIATSDTPAPALAPDGMSFDAEAYFGAVIASLRECGQRAAAAATEVVAVSVSGQRASVAVLGADGRACAPAMSWQGTVCGPAGDRFYARVGVNRFRGITGLLPSAIYTSAKLAHALEGGGLPRDARVGLLADYVVSRLGGDGFVTDRSQASATGLMDIREGVWSGELVAALGIETDRLPEIRPSGARAGSLSSEVARETSLPAGTPIVLGGGDQQCAVLGSGASRSGDCVLSLGTSAAVLCPTAQPPDPNAHGILFTAHVVEGQWVAEGFINSFGSAAAWASDVLGIADPRALEQLASTSELPPGEIWFVPFLAGIGSPDFDDRARAAFVGLTLSHSRADMARAVIEGIAFETRRVLEAFARHTPVTRLRAIGGGSRSDLLTRALADVTGRELVLSATSEAALLGAAMLGWCCLGHYEDAAAATTAMAAVAETPVAPAVDADAMDASFARYRELTAALREIDKR